MEQARTVVTRIDSARDRDAPQNPAWYSPFAAEGPFFLASRSMADYYRFGPRRTVVFELLLSGYEYKEIAMLMRISVDRVQRHADAIRRATGVRSIKVLWRRLIAAVEAESSQPKVAPPVSIQDLGAPQVGVAN